MMKGYIRLVLVVIGSMANSATVFAQSEIDCFSGNYLNRHQAQQCADEFSKFESKLEEYRHKLATFAIDVTISVKGKDYKSHGTGFLVSRRRNYIITAKHVIIGTKPVWDIEEQLERSAFIDFESAMEDLLASKENDRPRIFPGTGKIMVRPFFFQSQQGLSATVVAFDRSSDLALLHVKNLSDQAFASETLFRHIPLASRRDCALGMEILALGYKGSNLERSINKSRPAEVTSCHFTPQTVLIGGKYFRIPLYETNADFEPGMSGGPVIAYDRSLHRKVAVGVVAGGVPGQKSQYYVPASAVTNFLEKFGARFD